MTTTNKKSVGQSEQMYPADIEQSFSRVKNMRKELTGSGVMANTKRTYARRWEKIILTMHEEKKSYAEILENLCYKQLQVQKATISYALSQKVRRAMRDADIMWKDKTLTNAQKWEAYRKTFYPAIASAYDEYQQWKEEAKTIKPGKKDVKKEPNHKKKALKPEQMNAFFEKVPQNAKYRLHFIVASLCGCRPEEFANGVQVIKGEKEGKAGIYLNIINRAKCSETRKTGLETGSIFIAFDSLKGKTVDRVAELVESLGDNGKRVFQVPEKTTEHGNRKNAGVILSDSFNSFCRKNDLNMSFYSLRHTFSANVKATAKEMFPNAPQDQQLFVAELMGHQSTATQSNYARSNGGGEFSPQSGEKNAMAGEIRAKNRENRHPNAQKTEKTMQNAPRPR